MELHKPPTLLEVEFQDNLRKLGKALDVYTLNTMVLINQNAVFMPSQGDMIVVDGTTLVFRGDKWIPIENSSIIL